MTQEFIITGLFGLALLFAGLPLFRILLVAAGAWAGFVFGPELLAMLTGLPPGPALAWISAASLAVLLALVSWLVFWLARFVGGALIGYAVGTALTGNPLVGLGSGLVAGGITAAFGRSLVIVVTALAGAWLLLAEVATLPGLAGAPGGQLPLWFWPALLVVAIIGMAAQFRSFASAHDYR
jgi:hypothetical protein